MPSQVNIKRAEILLASLSELDAYLTSLYTIQEGRDENPYVTVTAYNTKHVLNSQDLKDNNLLSILISEAEGEEVKIIDEIGRLLIEKSKQIG
jgi:hypothetical protein